MSQHILCLTYGVIFPRILTCYSYHQGLNKRLIIPYLSPPASPSPLKLSGVLVRAKEHYHVQLLIRLHELHTSKIRGQLCWHLPARTDARSSLLSTAMLPGLSSPPTHQLIPPTIGNWASPEKAINYWFATSLHSTNSVKKRQSARCYV